MKQKKAEAVSIIGGADGPTSVFMVGSFDKKKPLKEHIRQCIYRFRHKRAEKKIYADPHTLKETAAYACEKYHADEIPKTQRRYTEQYASAKEGLIIMHKPELLGSLGEITWPDTFHNLKQGQEPRHCRQAGLDEICHFLKKERTISPFSSKELAILEKAENSPQTF